MWIINNDQKKIIKKNFDKINFEKLPKYKQKFYNKVKAGKIRAANSYKTDTGKYASKTAIIEIKKLVLAVNFDIDVSKVNTPQQLKKLIRESGIKESEILNNYKKNLVEFSKDLKNISFNNKTLNTSNFENFLEDYKGKFICNDGNLKFEISSFNLNMLYYEFKQFCINNIHCIDIVFTPKLFLFENSCEINIPDLKMFKKLLLSNFEIDKISDLQDQDLENIIAGVEDVLNVIYKNEPRIEMYFSESKKVNAKIKNEKKKFQNLLICFKCKKNLVFTKIIFENNKKIAICQNCKSKNII